MPGAGVEGLRGGGEAPQQLRVDSVRVGVQGAQHVYRERLAQLIVGLGIGLGLAHGGLCGGITGLAR
ncbi:hypothetical protein D3C77_430540 [compost metagenome]